MLNTAIGPIAQILFISYSLILILLYIYIRYDPQYMQLCNYINFAFHLSSHIRIHIHRHMLTYHTRQFQ